MTPKEQIDEARDEAAKAINAVLKRFNELTGLHIISIGFLTHKTDGEVDRSSVFRVEIQEL